MEEKRRSAAWATAPPHSQAPRRSLRPGQTKKVFCLIFDLKQKPLPPLGVAFCLRSCPRWPALAAPPRGVLRHRAANQKLNKITFLFGLGPLGVWVVGACGAAGLVLSLRRRRGSPVGPPWENRSPPQGGGGNRTGATAIPDTSKPFPPFPKNLTPSVYSKKAQMSTTS